jgi:DNA-binding transcriptional ArsR family regulator
MTTPRFDELIHAPTRLSIVALLGAADWAEFRFIRDTLEMSDSALSRQLTMLENAGYVEIRKAFIGKRPRTWARLSGAGRRAFEGHVLRLQEIVSGGGVSLGGDTASLAPAFREDEAERGAALDAEAPQRRRAALPT